MARSLERKATQTRVKRSTLSPPPEFVGDPIVWAAWLYYEERMTQEEVADRLGVSRASVVNFLQEARDRGVVTIAVAPEHLQTVRASRELSKRFGLTSCVVIPDDGGRLPLHERIGRAGARLLTEILEPNDILGVSWGRTVLALSAALERVETAQRLGGADHRQRHGHVRILAGALHLQHREPAGRALHQPACAGHRVAAGREEAVHAGAGPGRAVQVDPVLQQDPVRRCQSHQRQHCAAQRLHEFGKAPALCRRRGDRRDGRALLRSRRRPGAGAAGRADDRTDAARDRENSGADLRGGRSGKDRSDRCDAARRLCHRAGDGRSDRAGIWSSAT